MAETRAGQASADKRYDPFEAFRQMRDTWMETMSKSMIETVNTEAYAQSTGALLESTLSVAAPVRDAMNKSMVQALEQLSLPSRDDLFRLADRFTNIEMRLDDIDALLERIETKLDGSAKKAQALAEAEAVVASEHVAEAVQVSEAAAKATGTAYGRAQPQVSGQKRKARNAAK